MPVATSQFALQLAFTPASVSGDQTKLDADIGLLTVTDNFFKRIFTAGQKEPGGDFLIGLSQSNTVVQDEQRSGLYRSTNEDG